MGSDEKTCPIPYPTDKGWKSSECLEGEYAWWDKNEKCCAVVSIANGLMGPIEGTINLRGVGIKRTCRLLKRKRNFKSLPCHGSLSKLYK